MNIQAHLGIIMALEVMLDWMDQQGVGKILPLLPVQLFIKKPPDQQPSST
jgi:hypothetical protein